MIPLTTFVSAMTIEVLSRLANQILTFVLESFNERYFGIVSKKSKSDDSFYMVGTLVKVID